MEDRAEGRSTAEGYGWPFRVLMSRRFVEACMAKTPLRRLGYKGGIDQFVDSTDVLSNAAAARGLLRLDPA